MSEQLNKFTKIDNNFIARMHELSGSAVKVYLELRSFVDWNDNTSEGTAFPGYDTIREATGLSKPTISNCLDELIKFGWIIDIESKFNSSNRYMFGDGSKSNSDLLDKRQTKKEKLSASCKARHAIVKKLYYSSQKTLPPIVKKLDTNENQLTRTIKQEPLIHSTNLEKVEGTLDKDTNLTLKERTVSGRTPSTVFASTEAHQDNNDSLLEYYDNDLGITLENNFDTSSGSNEPSLVPDIPSDDNESCAVAEPVVESNVPQKLLVKSELSILEREFLDALGYDDFFEPEDRETFNRVCTQFSGDDLFIVFDSAKETKNYQAALHMLSEFFYTGVSITMAEYLSRKEHDKQYAVLSPVEHTVEALGTSVTKAVPEKDLSPDTEAQRLFLTKVKANSFLSKLDKEKFELFEQQLVQPMFYVEMATQHPKRPSYDELLNELFYCVMPVFRERFNQEHAVYA